MEGQGISIVSPYCILITLGKYSLEYKNEINPRSPNNITNAA